MASLNKVMLIGNLTRDPELRYTPSGTAVCDFSIAVNRKFKDGNNEQQEEVTFVDLTAWSGTAEVVANHLKKGRPVFVEGRLQLDVWDDKATGQKRSKMRIVVEQVQFLNSAPAREHPEERQYQRPGGSARPPGAPPGQPARRTAADALDDTQRAAMQRPGGSGEDAGEGGPLTEGLDGDDIPF